MAFKVSDQEYDLVLQNDINTKGHTQWYYFSVSNTSENLSVKFNIINLCKSGSLYNSGMKVLIRAKSEDTWCRGGEDISYFCNGIKKNKKGKSYYTMTFTYIFEKSLDTIYFAYSMPYTFTNIMDYLKVLEEDPDRKKTLTRRLLTYTLSGNRCDYLTITSPCKPEEIKKRRGVVISARVHPGETVGSWMMHGVIDFLTGSSEEAVALRENFIFKIIPMLNPDGVINGNYRCNLSGVDLNRRWKDPLKSLHPTIFAAKRLIKNFSKEREIELVCDLHGHSRKHNIFMYGCNVFGSPEKTRIYPYILSKISQMFGYKNCSFNVQKSKESTMRVSLFKEIKVPHVYTLEASFAGADYGDLQGVHFTTRNFQQMGKELCIAILINNNLQVNASDHQMPMETMKNEILQLGSCEDCQSSSGSDSDPSEDNLDSKEIVKLLVALPKAKTVKEKRTSPNGNHNLTVHIQAKNETFKHKSFHLLKKCSVCGEIEENNHVCSKSKNQSKKNIVPLPKSVRSRESSNKRSINFFSTSTIFQSLPVYFNAEGKKVRDQYTQTQYCAGTPRRVESVGQSMFFLDVTEKTPRMNSSEHKKAEESQPEHKSNLFLDKVGLPFLGKGKILHIEKYLKN